MRKGREKEENERLGKVGGGWKTDERKKDEQIQTG